MSSIPVLEVGGTHVAAALLDQDGWAVTRSVRRALDADAAAEQLLAGFVAAARELDAPPGIPWGIAMPDPFDYVRGIGNFAGVAKFAALDGVDVGAPLRAALGADVRFLNDADAFALGEWTFAREPRPGRLVGLTLGTGVGSGWIVDGQVADPGTPLGGRIHLLTVAGAPLEDTMSRRAIRRAYTAAGGPPEADVREIAAAARAGDATANGVLQRALGALGTAAAPAIARFAPDELVVGGSMTGSWDILGPPFRSALHDAGVDLPVRVSVDAARSGFVGAATHAGRRRT